MAGGWHCEIHGTWRANPGIVLPSYSLSGFQISFLQNGDRGLLCKIIMIDA